MSPTPPKAHHPLGRLARDLAFELSGLEKYVAGGNKGVANLLRVDELRSWVEQLEALDGRSPSDQLRVALELLRRVAAKLDPVQAALLKNLAITQVELQLEALEAEQALDSKLAKANAAAGGR